MTPVGTPRKGGVDAAVVGGGRGDEGAMGRSPPDAEVVSSSLERMFFNSHPAKELDVFDHNGR